MDKARLARRRRPEPANASRRLAGVVVMLQLVAAEIGVPDVPRARAFVGGAVVPVDRRRVVDGDQRRGRREVGVPIDDVGRAPIVRTPVTRARVVRAPVARAGIAHVPVSGTPVSRTPVTRTPVRRAPERRRPPARRPDAKAPWGPPESGPRRAAIPVGPATPVGPGITEAETKPESGEAE